MSSAVLSATRELPLRPGIARGAHPERREGRAPAIERALYAAYGLMDCSRRVRRSQVAALGRAIEREAAGLCDLDEAAFDARVAELRSQMRRAGTEAALVRRGFALVREAARRTLGTPHYDVQLFGGWVMVQRGLAELETGEGKTLTATLPSCIGALAGIPVHVITANDYLVERDAERMEPVYARLGIRVGCVVERDPEPDARRAAYACDVTYVTNKQIAFDYLRDRCESGVSRRIAHKLGVGVAGGGATGEPMLRGLCFAVVDEADGVLIDDAGTPLVLSRPGAAIDASAVRGALSIARSLDPHAHYEVDRRRGEVRLTPQGLARLDELAPASGALAGPRRRQEWVHRALHALHVLQEDRHYVVRDAAVEIIDLSTGRRAPDRAFEGGIHALLEAKLGLELTPQRETVARTTYQRFFRSYLRLGGMTGTARDVARELWSVYRLRTFSVPTRLPSQRRDLGLRLFPSTEAKWAAAVERVRELHEAGRPVLVGTCSVESSEALSQRLRAAALDHQVLNANQDEAEAAVVARAGEPARITVATQMAGRGTDIGLGPGVADAGGLAVVATEMGDARRIDRQLFGRCARQGAPGSHEQLASLEDGLLRTHLPGWLWALGRRPLLAVPLRVALTRAAQFAEERRSALARRRLMRAEQQLERMLAFSNRTE